MGSDQWAVIVAASAVAVSALVQWATINTVRANTLDGLRAMDRQKWLDHLREDLSTWLYLTYELEGIHSHLVHRGEYPSNVDVVDIRKQEDILHNKLVMSLNTTDNRESELIVAIEAVRDFGGEAHQNGTYDWLERRNIALTKASEVAAIMRAIPGT